MKLALIILFTAYTAPTVALSDMSSIGASEYVQPFTFTGDRKNCPSLWVDPLCKFR